jgi:hypothetical protein
MAINVLLTHGAEKLLQSVACSHSLFHFENFVVAFPATLKKFPIKKTTVQKIFRRSRESDRLLPAHFTGGVFHENHNRHYRRKAP